MATITNDQLTLLDYMKRCKGNGAFDYDLVDFVTKDNPILKDVTFIPSNDGTTHTVTMAVGKHDPQWLAYGEGTPHGKVNYKQVRFTAGRMVSAVRLEGDSWEEANEEGKSQMLQDELKFTAEGMNQKMAETMFYGNASADPRSFNGIFSLYNKCGGHLAGVSEDEREFYVINGAKTSSPVTTALRSIVCVAWDKSKFSAFYPKGHATVGIEKGKLEPVTKIDDSDGKSYKFYEQKLVWKAGLMMKDFRNCGAIRNIEADSMVTADGHVATGQPNYIQLVQRLINRVAPKGGGRKALYMPKLVWENLMTVFGNLTQGNAISFSDVDQYRQVPHLYGIPVSPCHCMDRNEEYVTVMS